MPIFLGVVLISGSGRQGRRALACPGLAKLMARLKAVDIVIVTKLDRFGRSTRELLDLIQKIGEARGRVSVVGRSAMGYFHSAGTVALDIVGCDRRV
jgi:Resolvase, N terminal domain